MIKIGIGPKKIEKRSSVIPDYTHTDFNAMSIYAITDDKKEGQDLKTRSNFFEQSADSMFASFYDNASLPDHILQVTCTGYTYPSAAQKIASLYNALNTTITNVYHMGCYAAIPAIRLASGMIKDQQTADIVHTEMCSLHMNPALHDPEQLVVQTLFADGFIKYTVSNIQQKGFEVLTTHEALIPESIDHMSWKQESWGMKMHIAKSVPTLIQYHVAAFVKTLFEKADIPFQTAYYAIHPGGPKIIDAIADTLSLQEKQFKHSTDILKQCGNMSSATLPHIWDHLLRDDTVQNGALIVSLAFGPGLTVAGAVMRKCCNPEKML